jgi:DNA-binding HxlR family transcriptional regulator
MNSQHELKRRLDGITQKALTQALRRLERSGILAGRVIPTSQVAVEYSITPLGRTLSQPINALYLWTLEHLDTVMKAQADFDSREIEAFRLSVMNGVKSPLSSSPRYFWQIRHRRP